MLSHQSVNTPEFRPPKSAALLQTNRLKPELRQKSVPLYVNVRRLIPVAREEKEPVRTAPKNRRHKPTLPDRADRAETLHLSS